jgi:futalosine hydrolase
MRTLVVTAVAAERDAAAAALGATPLPELPYDAVGTDSVVVAAAGAVGPVAAAVATSRLLTALTPAGAIDLVISAGIAGGFAGRAAIGDLVLANAVLFADLGALTDDGFADAATLGFAGGEALAPVSAGWVGRALTAAGLPVVNGTILTLATMTGTDAGAKALATAHPGAVAEAMEGYGVAWAAVEHGVPWAEVRAVSNTIGRRDRATWDIPAAFTALGKAIAAIAAQAAHR